MNAVVPNCSICGSMLHTTEKHLAEDRDPYKCARCGSPYETEEQARDCEENHKNWGALY